MILEVDRKPNSSGFLIIVREEPHCARLFLSDLEISLNTRQRYFDRVSAPELLAEEYVLEECRGVLAEAKEKHRRFVEEFCA